MHLRCWVANDPRMHVQSALQELGHSLQRASGVQRDPTEASRAQHTEALLKMRPDLLWVRLPNLGHLDSPRVYRRRAEYIAALVRAQASWNGIYVVESTKNNKAWDLEPIKRVRNELDATPQLVRWCSLGVKAESGAPTSWWSKVWCPININVQGMMPHRCLCGVPEAEHGRDHSDDDNQAATARGCVPCFKQSWHT